MNGKKYTCLIVDDEPIGREIIEDFVGRVEQLELTASCKNAFEALEILQRRDIDVLFSDIQMPNVNGMEMVRSLPHPPVVIFITAYSDFAVDSYELNITDYLVKPISFERFLQAVNKALMFVEAMRSNKPNPAIDKPQYIFLKADNKQTKILFNSIWYIETIKDYIRIHTPEKKLIVYSTMKGIEEKLPADKFYRIHQSYIVPIDQIKTLEGNQVELVCGASLPISKSHKAGLYRILNIGEGL